MWVLFFLFVQTTGDINTSVKGTPFKTERDCQFQAGMYINKIAADNPTDKVFSYCLEVSAPADLPAAPVVKTPPKFNN